MGTIFMNFMFLCIQRRLSDPSSNLNNFCRSGWKSMKGGDKGNPTATGKRARSQSDGLDYCGLAEIEAGDVRDGKKVSFS